MAKRHDYSPYTREAAELLGSQIREGRQQRRWPAEELARRVGVSRLTVHKVERGDPSVGLGTAFEAARLVGVPLFLESREQLSEEAARQRARLALLPQRVRAPHSPPDDDF